MSPSVILDDGGVGSAAGGVFTDSGSPGSVGGGVGGAAYVALYPPNDPWSFLPADAYNDIVFRGNRLGFNTGQVGSALVDVYTGRFAAFQKRQRYSVGKMITDAKMSMSWSAVTQLTMEIEDPDLEMYRAGVFDVGGEVGWRTYDLVVNSKVLGPGKGGRGGVTVTCRPVVVQKIKQRRGPLIMGGAGTTGARASDFVQAECEAIGATYYIQPSPVRSSIIRDVPKTGQAYNADEYPSSWTTFQRLAREEGYMLFESFNVIYFCKPSYLWGNRWKNGQFTPVYWGLDKSTFKKPKRGKYPDQEAITVPNVTYALDQHTTPTITANIEVLLQTAPMYPVGWALQLKGLSGENENAPLLISAVEYNLAGVGTCQVTAESPIDPKATVTSAGIGGGLGSDIPNSGAVDADTYAGVRIDATQAGNVTSIYNAAREVSGVTKQDILCCLMTAMTESTFHIYTNPSVPDSTKWPNDGPPPSGGDHDSVGLFQQRASWGSVKDRMDPYKSTKFFLDRLMNIPNRANYPLGDLCQKVQVSAYPDRYAKWKNLAVALYNALLASTASTGSGSGVGGAAGGAFNNWHLGHPLNTKLVEDFVAITMTRVGAIYDYGAPTPAPTSTHANKFDCSSLVQWGAGQVGVDYPRSTYDQWPWITQKHLVIPSVHIAKTIRGAVLFRHPLDGDAHTGISLGNGKVLQAYDTGVGVIVSKPGDQYGVQWTNAGFIPGMTYPASDLVKALPPL